MVALMHKSVLRSVVVIACLACGIHGRELQALAELLQRVGSLELAEWSQSAKRLTRLHDSLEVFASLLQVSSVAAFQAPRPGWKQHVTSHAAIGRPAHARGHSPAMQGTSMQQALSRGQPIIVDLQVDDPSTAWDLDVEDLSERLRKAKAAAMVAPKALLETFVREQARAKSDYPGPVPVLCDFSAEDASGTSDAIKELASQGAAGVMVRCVSDDALDALHNVITAATAAGLDSIVVAGSEAVRAAANEAGATAVACAFADAEVDKDKGVAVQLGAWNGDEDELKALRERGFRAMLLLDGCGGDVAKGSAWCEYCLSVHRSKKSSLKTVFFSTNSGDIPPPEVRNPRLWAQSQRQAREIMHESARSRDLPPPQLKRNTVLPGKSTGSS